MDRKQLGTGSGVFFICLLLGIIFDQLALGIIVGLLLGGGSAKAMNHRD